MQPCIPYLQLDIDFDKFISDKTFSKIKARLSWMVDWKTGLIFPERRSNFRPILFWHSPALAFVLFSLWQSHSSKLTFLLCTFVIVARFVPSRACVARTFGIVFLQLVFDKICDWNLQYKMASISLLNPKAEFARAAQALAINISAGKGLQDVMKTNLGPKGTMKM